jgi:hypothetical protein
LGFQFWNQYSDVDAVFAGRIILAINTQETNRLAKQQTQGRDRHHQSVFAKYEPIIEASSVSLPHPTCPLPAAFDAATDEASISDFSSQPASIFVYSDHIGPFCHGSSVSEVAILHPSGLSLPSFDYEIVPVSALDTASNYSRCDAMDVSMDLLRAIMTLKIPRFVYQTILLILRILILDQLPILTLPTAPLLFSVVPLIPSLPHLLKIIKVHHALDERSGHC